MNDFRGKHNVFFFTSMFLLLEGKPHVVCGYMSVCSHIREFSIEFYGIFGTTWNQQALIGCFPFSILATLHLFLQETWVASKDIEWRKSHGDFPNCHKFEKQYIFGVGLSVLTFVVGRPLISIIVCFSVFFCPRFIAHTTDYNTNTLYFNGRPLGFRTPLHGPSGELR